MSISLFSAGSQEHNTNFYAVLDGDALIQSGLQLADPETNSWVYTTFHVTAAAGQVLAVQNFVGIATDLAPNIPNATLTVTRI